VSILHVSDLLEKRQKSLDLVLVAGETGLSREITSSNISSPGLALAGFTDRFESSRMQVLGETEVMFLRSMEPGARQDVLDAFLAGEVPVVFVTKALEPPSELLRLAEERSIPVLKSNLKTGEFYRRIRPFLDEEFAPSTAIHGSVADVYGVGLLFVGASGIGKSECVLDLVERGHRLVADDVVLVRRRGLDVLIGQAHEHQQHHMEIRGIGIIDVRALFGVRAVRQQKRIEVVVQLEHWQENASYDRTGLERDTTEILGTSIPRVVIPLNPGKNITVISEVVAMNHLLRYAGVDSAQMFEHNLRLLMQPVRDYLEEDYE
jgi:HPr kinase/phosphorylase